MNTHVIPEDMDSIQRDPRHDSLASRKSGVPQGQMSRPPQPPGPRRWPVRRSDLALFLSSDARTGGRQRVLKTDDCCPFGEACVS
jgi:hypothetical protein